MHLFSMVKYFLLSPTRLGMGLKTGIVQESCLEIASISTILLTHMKQTFRQRKQKTNPRKTSRSLNSQYGHQSQRSLIKIASEILVNCGVTSQSD